MVNPVAGPGRRGVLCILWRWALIGAWPTLFSG
jgi:hypothetical protein